MQIVIVGCGNVGRFLAKRLSKEGHNITLIDKNEEVVHYIVDEIDAIAFLGDGADVDVLKNAGVDKSELFIAVTGSDEKNILCCAMAKRLGGCSTIARVTDPVYNKGGEYIQNIFGVDMLINPELITANEISRVLQFMQVSKIDVFSGGNVELFHFHIVEGSRLSDNSVIRIMSQYKSDVLFCTVKRQDKIIIPNGDFVFKTGDTVGIVGNRKSVAEFLKKIGLKTGKVSEVLIAGGGKTAFYLAQKLILSGTGVSIIEKDMKRCELLAEKLEKATIVHADATDAKVLERENLSTVGGFVASLGVDEENILLSLYAMNNTDAKIITRIHRMNFSETIENLNLDTIMNPQIITADYIVRYARSIDNARGIAVQNLYSLEGGNAEALEFSIDKNYDFLGKPLESLKLKNNTIICTIFRNGTLILPKGKDEIRQGDSVIIVVSDYKVKDISDIFERH